MSQAEERALAIVGVSAILPDAPDARTFWKNVVESRYSIRDIPEGRWDPALYYDPDPSVPDKTYSRIGGWVREWEWEPLAWRLPIPPRVAQAMDEAQKWAVACARAVLLDYGHPQRPLDFERTAVVVGTAMAGNLHYLTSLRVFFPEYAQALSEAPSFQALPEAAREAIRSELHERIDERLPEITEDTMPGELANCIAGRIANLFDFHGPNFVCDAACASALAAIDAAHDGLLEGQYDAALVGGVDRNMGPAPFVKFSKIGALSASGTRPYADGADGFVMGEGSTFFLVKRLADAEAQGDRIYAVLRGVAGSSDGRGKGITAPNPVGQQLAIERAWRDAGLSPASATLVEGHGTSTRVGDVVEVESLSRVFGGAGAAIGSIGLGSVKSNIGHLKGAAGGAGLLKTVLALHEKVLPPSLNCERPNPSIDFAHSPFVVNTETKPWDAPPDGVRRAGVSAFGFGGTNYHAVLEEYQPGRLARPRSVAVPGTAPEAAPSLRELGAPPRGALVLGEADAAALRARLAQVVAEAEAGRAPAPEAPLEAALRAAERIAIDYADAAELASKGARALRALDAPAASAVPMWRALAAQGVFHGRGGAPKTAFLYTGQGSQYPNMLRELRESEPIVAETFAEADRTMEPLIGRPLSEIIFVDPRDEAALRAAEAELRRTEITQPAVLAVDTALTRLLASWGIVPDLVMGHSLGEYGALVAAGCLPFSDALEAVSARGREMASLEIEDKGRMAAVFAPLGEVEEMLASIDGNVVIANINSGNQCVIGGASAAVESAVGQLVEAGHQVVELPVSHAFHTSIVAPASEPLRRTLERLRLAPPQIPLVGNLTGELYPMAADAVPKMIDLLAAQVASPVQFVKGLETLYAEGARIFVEVGPKKALHGFAVDVLGEREGVSALFTNHPKLHDRPSFNQALCGLWAGGLGVGRREQPARPVEVAAPAATPAPTPAVAASAPPPATSLPADRYAELGRMFAEFVERGARLLREDDGPAGSEPTVVTGASLGLPGRERVFDDRNAQYILDGEQEIDLIPTRFRHAMVDKHITRLVKGEGGDPHFEAIGSSAEVIKLAARAGTVDLEAEYGVSADRIEAFDAVTKLAVAAGLDALRDAGIPLVMHYRTTHKGTLLPERWMLPEALRDETGVIFASVFPGFDSFADELTRFGESRAWDAELEILQSLRSRAAGAGDAAGGLSSEIDRRIHELEQARQERGYRFDRRFLFRVLAMGHSQLAEYIGARGPNTQINAACASTTQAFAVAQDWIAAGRCRRVVIVAADDVTTENLLEWVGAGFLASGAAATDDVVEEAALPFDRRRHGMILGMGAAGIVIEASSEARQRGLRPICEVLSTVTANSAFHGTRLDVEHIAGVMERLVAQAERRFGLDRRSLARELLFVSHETYTPARGGSASAEVESLRRVFGEAAASIVVANTKGLTGHPMGVGIEDVVAIKALETGTVPPVPNFREPDPELGPLNLSRGGAYPIRYALRLGAGFGSQISMSLLRWSASPDGSRPAADALGYAGRVESPERFQSWLQGVSGDAQAELEVVRRTLRVRDRGPAARHEATAQAAPVAPPRPVERAAPAPAPPPSPAPAAAAPSAAAPDREAEVLARVLGIVAEKTGYPADMLDPELDLEADLGIDTVKQAETFAAIREAYGIPRDENLALRDYPTLAHAVRFVMERTPGESAAPAAAAAATAAPGATAAPAAAGGREAEVLARVLGIVAEKTGYPADMLDPELDLEADLGIDTVKQAETFAAIREAYGIPRDENLALRDYPTLAHAVRFVMERTPGESAAPAAAAAATAAPAAAGGREAEVLARVLGIVAEKTGYPADMLDPELDLEADLGIDTVKQAETFAAIREAYGIPRDENLALRDYPTLAHAVRFVMERTPGESAAPAAAAAATAAPGATAAPAAAELLPPSGDLEASRALPRRLPRPVLRPPRDLCKATGVELASSSRVVVMPDRGGVAKTLSRRLADRGVEVLRLDPALEAPALVEQLRAWREAGPIHGVYWLPALDAEGGPEQLELPEWREALRVRVKLLYAAMRELYEDFAEAGRFLVSATRMGGAHGYDEAGASNPMGGAVSGFTKAFARERPEALVKAVDLVAERKTAEPADLLIEETLLDPGAVEVGVRGGRRFGIALVESPLEEGGGGIALGEDAVVVVTGAAGSIVAAITADLAQGGGRFHLLDITPPPQLDDPDLALFHSDLEALKRQIFERLKAGGERATPVQVERELAAIERRFAAASAMRAVAAAGGEAHWHQVDLTDAESVAKVVDEIREAGRIDLLVHAAGLERSRALPDKPPEEFDRVLDVKCDGWFNLRRAFADLQVGAVVFFCSIAGRFGNAGQTDYSAANDLLCKIASQHRGSGSGTRALAIDWSAWAEIGMASRGSIPEVMARAGIDMLPPAAAIPVVRREVVSGGQSAEILVAGRLGALLAERDESGGLDPALLEGGPLVGRVVGMGVQQGLCARMPLDPTQPFLNDHRIDGTPVLPGVVGVEGFVELARLLFPDLRVAGVEDVEFLAPFKLYRDEPREAELRARFEVEGDEVVADCGLYGSRLLPGQEEPQETLHFRGRVRLRGESETLERVAAGSGPAGRSLGAEDVYRVYFHGPAFQVLSEAWRDGEDVLGRFEAGLPALLASDPGPLSTPARLLELVFQAAGVGEIATHGRMGLPRRVDRIVFGAPDEGGELTVRVVGRGEGQPCDAVVFDAKGNLRLRVEGYVTTPIPAPLEAALRDPIAAALG